jgi:hypothetical protein
MSNTTPESPNEPEPATNDTSPVEPRYAAPADDAVRADDARDAADAGDAEDAEDAGDAAPAAVPAAGHVAGGRAGLAADTSDANAGYPQPTAEEPGYQPVTEQPPVGYEPPTEPLPPADAADARTTDTRTTDANAAPAGENAAPAETTHAETAAATNATGTTWAPEPTAAPRSVEPTGEQRAEEQRDEEAARTATPVYVTAPTPPTARGNRGIGILIVLLATLVYAIVYAAVSLAYFALNFAGRGYLGQFESYVTSVAFWVPVAAFFVLFVLLVAIVNRGGWWAYVLGGFLVAVGVYFAYIGGALLEVQAWTMTAAQANRLLAQLWANPLTLGAAIVARELTLWFGAWIAARGRRVRQRNLDAKRDFDREVAEGPAAPGSAPASSWSNR